MTDTSQVDKLILRAAGPRWLKVARIIAVVAKEMGSELPDGDEGWKEISRRIDQLVKNGLLQAQGNTANWFFSEVRLPDDANSKD